ncbi:uncharacterized protein LOC129598294 isoform X2 [Paramacrobiotus metropolitanus]|uniref:uncharacterized protein LOC129598294 isoform X2 n=1 Tax=Paramacrobiotus metropolitanus TaxID=2943436 RepID=UPI002445A858|nr:uncharacterized protein LOC129598294 isoform X2 [Paramacrobiotus metropolitanus]
MRLKSASTTTPTSRGKDWTSFPAKNTGSASKTLARFPERRSSPRTTSSALKNWQNAGSSARRHSANNQRKSGLGMTARTPSSSGGYRAACSAGLTSPTHSRLHHAQDRRDDGTRDPLDDGALQFDESGSTGRKDHPQMIDALPRWICALIRCCKKLCGWRCACFLRDHLGEDTDQPAPSAPHAPHLPEAESQPCGADPSSWGPGRDACRDIPRFCSAHLALPLLPSARVEGGAMNGKAIWCCGRVIVYLLAAAAMSPGFKTGTVCLSPTCLWWLMLLLLPQLHLSAGCPPQQATPTNLEEMLAEAMLHSRQDDRIVLTKLVPSDYVTDSVIYRPRLGEDATFNCIVPADVDWREVAWLHEGWPVFEGGEPQPLPARVSTGQTYNFTRLNDTLILIVRNVTMGSGGSVQCVIDPVNDLAFLAHRRALARYVLLPLITRRSEVFAAPAETNVTATEGEAVTVQWSIRLPLPQSVLQNLPNHLMWLHQGRILRGPWEAPYGLPLPAGAGPRAVEAYYIRSISDPGRLMHVRLLFRSVKMTDGGSVQCWFRPHEGVHEWIVDTKTLLVIPSNST